MRALGLCLLLLASPALAQAPARVSGTVVAASPDRLEVRTASGELAVALPPGVRIITLARRSLDSIKPGEFVGSAAVRGRDGKLHAQEVRIFPESMRGLGEGHRPMAGPDQSMTNATVEGVAAAPDGRTLHLRYPGGEQAIEVGPDVPVTAYVPGDRSLLVPGAAVRISGTRDGETLTASFIQAGTPP